MVTNNCIRSFLGYPTSPHEFEIKQVDSLDRCNHNALLFINKQGIDLSELDEKNSDCVYIIDESYIKFSTTNNDYIRVKNPKYVFCQLVEEFQLRSRLQNTYLRPQYRKLPIDVIYCYEILIGSNCQIDPGAIIGGTDFSPVLGDEGNLIQFPQMGGVKIGDNVVIKYNTMVGKGTFGFTTIGDNTMIDFGCQIGHNCSIGDRCIIAAGTIIGGSTTIGNDCVIGIGAKIRNGLHIGNNVSIGMGAVVIKDIPDNSVVVGNPARIIEHKKIFDEKGLV